MKVTERLAAEKDDDLEIKVELKETVAKDKKYWQYQATFPGCDGVNKRSYKSFFNTIGLYSKEDWDDWIEVSEMLGLPMSADGVMDDFELAMSTDVDGSVEITCVGNE